MRSIINWITGKWNSTPQMFIEEDILKIIFKINEDKLTICKKDILEKLDYPQDSIEKAIATLLFYNEISEDKEYFEIEEKGKKRAIKLIRKHRIYEKYLAEKTGFSKSNWHHKAEKKEHLLTDEQVDNMEKELGFPKFDPHGDPIPTKDGVLPKLKGKTLNLVTSSTIVKIIHMEDEPHDIYKSLIKKEIHMGSIMKVQKQSNGTIDYYTEGKHLKLSKKEAKNLQVVIIEQLDDIPMGVIRLTALKSNEKAIITGLSSECRGINRRRLLDLGFVKGTKISIGMVSPMQDPKAFLIRETLIALRKEQTDMILIKKLDHDTK
ncbi:metal-dependent transcriptional regulator [Flammeovirga agarivorans]|uniref:Metal-dependent transcriptional regulator n=1 Tax=Flammeovirga agarivorans TaxID=2726742 RepID=A0A7X8XWR7_9BACT|nr:metal-dependent transcriptional regulator [Flammeovirga agarivorans]NLR92553.1 metal-dependent transcriptional regulator [Flammeovirga agarivorans]